jgi:outer membrane protein OmpA-like peptidoglycan-associated protein
MKKITLSLFGLLFIQSAIAQQNESVNSHLFRFSDTLETVSIEDAMGPDSEMVREGRKFMFRASFDYIKEPLIAIDSTRDNLIYDLVNNLYTVTVGGGFFITPKLWFGATIPFHHIELANPFATTDPKSYELGDIPVYLKWRITGDHAWANVALMPYVNIPTGEKDYLVTDDSYGMGGKLLVDKRMGRLKLFGTAGFTYAKNATFLTINRTKRIELGAGAYIDLAHNREKNRELGLNAETTWGVTVVNYDEDQNPMDVRAGLRAKFSWIVAFAGVGLSSVQDARSGKIGYYAGIKCPFGSAPKAPVVATEPAPVLTPTPEPIATPVVQEWKKNIEVARSILYKTSSAVIDSRSYPELDSAAATIMPYMDKIGQITIHGHTDSVGAASYNLKLSQARAESVKSYLVNKGIPSSKLLAVGHGEEQLKISPEVTPEDKAMNRRVEFEVKEIVTETVTK